MSTTVDKSLEQRVGDTYEDARRRPWAPIAFLDGRHMQLRAELRAIATAGTHPMLGTMSEGAKKNREEMLLAALKEFERWATMPEGDIRGAIAAMTPPPPPPTERELVHTFFIEMRRKGVSISTDGSGLLTVQPASKVPAKDWEHIASMKPAIVAELTRDLRFV